MFDAAHLSRADERTNDAFAPSHLRVLQELVATQRTFDEEHPRSAEVLNDAADMMTDALGSALLLPGEIWDRPLVQEYSSRDVDQLQAADIAAGWAHELLAIGDERALVATFGRVIVNGRSLA